MAELRVSDLKRALLADGLIACEEEGLGAELLGDDLESVDSVEMGFFAGGCVLSGELFPPVLSTDTVDFDWSEGLAWPPKAFFTRTALDAPLFCCFVVDLPCCLIFTVDFCFTFDLEVCFDSCPERLLPFALAFDLL